MLSGSEKIVHPLASKGTYLNDPTERIQHYIKNLSHYEINETRDKVHFKMLPIK